MMLIQSVVALLSTISISAAAPTIQSTMPDEAQPHEGTWLSWPHRYTYGRAYSEAIEPTWIAMAKALVDSENVHIVVYNNKELKRVRNLLGGNNVNLNKVDFIVKGTDDAWIRDNGPMFVLSNSNDLQALDWGFNGWGKDAPYGKVRHGVGRDWLRTSSTHDVTLQDDQLPKAVAEDLGLTLQNLNSVVLEGGAIEVDGRGTLMATKSSVLYNKRNPGMSEATMEGYMLQYMGVTNVVWLEGKPGGNLDITDYHIDGFARFADSHTIVTMGRSSLRYWGLSNQAITTLYNAKDVDGKYYDYMILPLTRYNVKTTYGKKLGYKGSYINFYTANTVVLMPSYNDPNDNVARNRLQKLYPSKMVIKIDVRNLYREGGMVHCVTQQQPALE